MAQPLLRCVNLTKSVSNSPALEILNGITFEIYSGQSIAIVGASGSGKTTLLHLLALLDEPDRGELKFLGKSISPADGEELRRHSIGIVFQAFYLLEDRTVLHNVLLPAIICGDCLSQARSRAELLLEKMHLHHRKKALARTLSGGEKQRLCMARALLRRPKLILADEFTGNLDSSTSQVVQRLLFEQIDSDKSALILVTHDNQLAKRCLKRFLLKEGFLREITN